MLSLRIAYRYLRSKKTHNAVNVISWISMAGVAVATAAIVVVMSVFNGFAQLAESHLSLFDAPVKVVARHGKTIANGDSLALALAALPQVAAAVPVIEERALAVYNGHQMPVRIKGVGPGSDTSPLRQAVIDGQYMPDQGFATVCVNVANTLLAAPNPLKLMYLYTPRRVGRLNAANPMASFRADSLPVGGVFQINQPEYDMDYIVVPLATARQLLAYDTEATAIEITPAPDANIHQITKQLGPEFQALTKYQQQEEAFRMIAIEKWVTVMMLGFILLIASFNIISTMSMLIVEKRDNIATMRALGASRGLLRRIFTTQAWLITAIGGGMGMVLGVALVLAQQYGGFVKLNGDATELVTDVYPVHLIPADLLVVAALVAVVGLLTSAITIRTVNKE